jgi:polyisoprenyl-teichoic acid--peptidoglycan teichoic acid transferase
MKKSNKPPRSGDRSINSLSRPSVKVRKKLPKKTENSNTNDSRFFNNTQNNHKPDFKFQAIDKDDQELGLGSYKKHYKSGKRYMGIKTKIGLAITGVIVLIVIIFAGYFVFKIQQSGSKIFKGNIADILRKNDPLKVDEYGRSNFLVFGTSEDDPDNGGALLTDSIMVIGINSKTGAANAVSIPRDLWVNYGINCPYGKAGKINATYICALEANNYDNDAAGIYFTQKVSEVLGIEIHYYASVNYSAIRDVVDVLGGIEVKIQSSDPRGIFDVNTKLNLSNGIQKLDGQTALNLARARNSEGGYGLSRSNFDREKNQQLIVNAIRSKALSSGTLTDIYKVISLIEILGDNTRTNLEGAEVRSAVSAVQNINAEGIVSVSISEGDSKLVTTGTQGGQSIVLPIAGLYEYGEISKHVNSIWSEE